MYFNRDYSEHTPIRRLGIELLLYSTNVGLTRTRRCIQTAQLASEIILFLLSLLEIVLSDPR